MAVSHSTSPLDLSISLPGFTTPHGQLLHATQGGGGGYGMRDFDINEVPSPTMEEEDSGSGGGGNKKLRLSKEQTRLLEESFRANHILNAYDKDALAFHLGLRPRQVEVWFQNRRARTKLKQTEMECEYLKRWFGSLTAENKRLQREVEYLRSIRGGGPGPGEVDPVEPPSARVSSLVSMCPRCKRVTKSNGPIIDKGPTENRSLS